ncbi:MAG: hypothetical protein ACJ74O_13925 [Frankiaceae bacterium]
MFFAVSSLVLGLTIFAVVCGSTALGVATGRSLRRHGDSLHAPFGALQAALLGFVGLLLAFGLSLAVGRYESRRVDVVSEANAIGTAYLRAQTLPEPIRRRSLALLVRYTDVEIDLGRARPDSAAAKLAIARGTALQRQLWGLAGDALRKEPVDSAERLYVDSLNAMIDSQGVRAAGLSNRVPTPVLVLEVAGAAVALGLLGLYLAVLGRGVATVMLAAAFVTLLLLITFDLDRPTRGLITIPSTPLTQLRTSMSLPPAAHGGR